MDLALYNLNARLRLILHLGQLMLQALLELLLHVSLVAGQSYFNAILLFLDGFLETLAVLLERFEVKLVLELLLANRLQLVDIFFEFV